MRVRGLRLCTTDLPPSAPRRSPRALSPRTCVNARTKGEWLGTSLLARHAASSSGGSDLAQRVVNVAKASGGLEGDLAVNDAMRQAMTREEQEVYIASVRGHAA